MKSITFSDAWHATFPGGHLGLLHLGPVDNSRRPTPLEGHKKQLITDLRGRFADFSRADLLQMEVLQAYKRYYRRFNKTYHVLLQLESVLHKGRGLPQVNPLVDACFAAELETHCLTASHDIEQLDEPVHIDAATGQESMIRLSGKQQALKAGDMIMVDGREVVCSIIYGQDRRTAVTEQTQHVLYVTYAPVGVGYEAVVAHHQTLRRNVALFAPQAEIVLETITAANS